MCSTFFLLPLVLLEMAFACSRAGATLGGGAETIEKDRQMVSGTLTKSASHGSYSVREIKGVSTSLKEYLSNDGIIFGVTWRGAANPNLKALLGEHFQEFSEAQAKYKRRMRGPLRTIRGANVVVERFGHMRALGGRAFLPALFPKGVVENDLQ